MDPGFTAPLGILEVCHRQKCELLLIFGLPREHQGSRIQDPGFRVQDSGFMI